MLPETAHKGRFYDLAEFVPAEIPEIRQTLRNRQFCLVGPPL
jgi:hypothetical protein